MTKATPKDVAASVRARLRRLAQEQNDDVQLVLTRYANERLLFRLASSRYAERFVLKGAALFTVWAGRPHRATRDLDLLGFGDVSPAAVLDVFREVLDAIVTVRAFVEAPLAAAAGRIPAPMLWRASSAWQ